MLNPDGVSVAGAKTIYAPRGQAGECLMSERLTDEQLREFICCALGCKRPIENRDDTCRRHDMATELLALRAELEKARGESTGWCKRAIVAEKERDSARALLGEALDHVCDDGSAEYAEERALRARIAAELGDA